MQMLEPDVTTSEVVLMYVGIFVFLFGLVFCCNEKKFLIVQNKGLNSFDLHKLRVIKKF